MAAPTSRVGTVFPTATIPLLTQAGGRIAQVPVTEGQLVRRGQLLLALDGTRARGEVRLLETTLAHQAAMRLQRLQLEMARTELRRDEALFQEQNLAAKNLEDTRNRVRLASEQATIEAERLDEQRQTLALRREGLKELEVRAPADGILASVQLFRDQVIAPGARLGELLVVDPAVVETFVPLAEARQLAPGRAVSVQAGVSRMGRVRMVGEQVEPVSGTVRVRIAVPNPDRALKPGMQVRVLL